MERIVFLERETVRADVRRPDFPHEWREHSETDQAEVAERLREATIAIINKSMIREEELSQLPGLKLIAVAATGVDKIDIERCRRSGVTVTNVRGYAIRSVPEHVFMMLLALRRSLIGYREAVTAGEWSQSERFCLLSHPILDVSGTTLGIMGYGALGRAVERLALALEMRVLIAEHKGARDVRPGRLPFRDVLQSADHVTLHVPLNDQTRGMIGAAEFLDMKRDAVLINCGRGGLVDEAALAEALRKGTIAGAGVDVVSREPPVEGNPLLEVQTPNLIVTPHIAWASAQAMQALADQLVDNIEAFMRGDPRNSVTSS